MNSKEPFRPEGRTSSPYFSPNASSHAASLAALTLAISGDEEQIDLGQAALVIAADHYPHLNVAAYERQLDTMAQEACERIRGERSPERIVAALNAYLFKEQGFRGNAQDYYNPANSFLNKVLDTRRGLPITLSIVYVALAQRLGLPICGIGLPLHFIVRYETSAAQESTSASFSEFSSEFSSEIFSGGLLIDPFHGGEILTPQTCQERIERIMGRPIAFDPAYLQPTPNRLILYRLLNNLKQVYMKREEPEHAGRVVEQMLVVAPDSADDIRDRGLLFLQERAFSRAVNWLTRYLECVPDASDASRIQRAIEQAYHLRAQLN